MKYRCNWQTVPSPGSTFYSGAIEVTADDEDDANLIAQTIVWRQSFRGYSRNHIRITQVTAIEKAPV